MLIPKPLFIWLKESCVYKKTPKTHDDEDNLQSELRSSLNTLDH